MKQLYLTYLFWVFSPICIFGQSIFENSITGTNPSSSNPYTIGQIVDPHITVSGIGRGSGLSGVNSNDRYDANEWPLLSIGGLLTIDSDNHNYFEFTITPNTDWKIDFVSFEYHGQRSVSGPTEFSFRSDKASNYGTNIGLATAEGTTIALINPIFQGVTSSTTFRLYAGGLVSLGTFSINDFKFNGVVSCITPGTPTLTVPSFSCSSTSFGLTWVACSNASNYFIDVATDSGFLNYVSGYQNKSLGSGLTTTVNGLNAGGTYYVRLRAANSCATSVSSNVIKVAPPETTLNGTIWSNGNPDATKNVIFASAPSPITSLFNACSCQINSGVNVVVGVSGGANSDAILKLQNGLDIQGTGTLTFENNASLVQVNDAALNTGKIIYKRITAPMKNFDYTYWASPVKNQKLNILSPNTLSDKYFSFANGNWVYENGANPMDPAGKGFIIRVPKPQFWTNPAAATYAQPVQFEGVPNNGIVNIASQGVGKDNLIGNPYPSAIDAETFIIANAAVIGGALNFWTHNTAIKQDGSFYVYNSDDYASYTLTGGVGTGVGTVAPSAGALGTKPNGKIAAGVSFFVTSKADGNFVFNNSMRNSANVLASNSNNQFFRMANTAKTGTIEKNRIWLNLTNSEGVFKQLLIGYVTGATNEMDNLYDGISSDGNTYVDFYSVNKENKLVIQGRALPFVETDQVPLGFKTTIDGTFEIKIDQTDGLLGDCAIYLEDKNTGILHNLKEKPYTFSALKGESNSRFVLSYKKLNLKSGSGEEIEMNTKQELAINTQEKQLSIKSRVRKISSVVIYDVNGKLLYQKKDIDAEQTVIPNLVPKHQILIIKTVFDNSTYQTNKVVF